MPRKIQVNIVVASHLSDAQHLIQIGKKEEANKHINFAKYLIFDHFITDVTMTNEELDKIWDKIN